MLGFYIITEIPGAAKGIFLRSKSSWGTGVIFILRCVYFRFNYARSIGF